MKSKICLLCAALVCLLPTGLVSKESVPPLVRLHVLAESDSEEDQARKLIVRDAVLSTAQEMLCECESYANAYAILDERIAEIESSAQAAAGDVAVRAELTQETYPDRDYGSFTLPQGKYTSLKVTLGAGEGRNWWCVVYPSLCMPESEQAEEIGALLTRQPLHSAIWDWLRSLWPDNNALEDANHV